MKPGECYRIPENTRRQIERSIADNSSLLVSAVQDLVRIRSVAREPESVSQESSGPAAALARALSIAEELGFSAANLDSRIGYAEYGSGDEYVAVLGHLDTVPEGDGWSYPPLGGAIHDGRIYGRGSLDDKGPVLAALFAMNALRESGAPLARKVRVIFGTDEETGSTDIGYYLSRNPPPVFGFTPDSDFPVVFAEKGILWLRLGKKIPPAVCDPRIISITGGTAPNMVPGSARAVLATDTPDAIFFALQEYVGKTGAALFAENTGAGLVIRSRGLSAHASRPDLGINAVMQLIGFLATLDGGNPELSAALRFFDRRIGTEQPEESFGLAMSDTESGNLTLNAGILEVTEDSFSITLDIRHPVTVSRDGICPRVGSTVRAGGFDAEVLKYDPPLYYSPESPLVASLHRVYREVTGDSAPPVAIGGGTYARKIPNVVAFGPYRPGTEPPIHAPDEYIAIDELLLLARIYAYAICTLANTSV